MNRIKKELGLPKDFRANHGLRHVFASMLVSDGVVLFTVQKLLTHKDPPMTQGYAHLRDDAFRKGSDRAMEIINQVLD